MVVVAIIVASVIMTVIAAVVTVIVRALLFSAVVLIHIHAAVIRIAPLPPRNCVNWLLRCAGIICYMYVSHQVYAPKMCIFWLSLQCESRLVDMLMTDIVRHLPSTQFGRCNTF